MNKNRINASQQNIKEERPKKSSNTINDIITNVNKSHNINTKITSNKKTEEKKKLSQSRDSPKSKSVKNIKMISPKNKEKNNNKITFNKKRNIQLYNGLNIDKSIDNDSIKPVMINNAPRITKEKLKQIQERRRKRIMREKKGFEQQSKMLNEKKALKDNHHGNKKDDIQYSNKINSPIEMSQKKAQSILEEGGMIDAYKFLISHLCKNGMPPGNLYEYCSTIIKNYEKEWKKKKYKMLNEKIQKYFEDKRKSFLLLGKMNLNNNFEYKALEKREENQFIKKLDKSRSSLRIIRKNPIANNNTQKNENLSNKNSISFEKNRINGLKKITGGNVMLNGNKNKNDKKVYFNIKLKNTVGVIKNDKSGGGKSTKSSIVNNNNNINNKIGNLKTIKNNSNNNNIAVKNTISNINKNIKNSPKVTKKEENKNNRINSSKSNSKIIKSNNTTKSNLKKNKYSKNIS